MVACMLERHPDADLANVRRMLREWYG
jgi:hypothetical protein